MYCFMAMSINVYQNSGHIPWTSYDVGPKHYQYHDNTYNHSHNSMNNLISYPMNMNCIKQKTYKLFLIHNLFIQN